MTGRTLVTGATGFLGRPLLRRLLEERRPVVACARRLASLRDLEAHGLELVALDVRDADACATRLAGVDTVIHLAAARNRPGTNPRAMREVNELATLRLARQALASGVRRFVHLSTALVFGPSDAPLGLASPLVLDDVVAGAYVASKARAVRGLRDLAAAGAPVSIVHPTIVYGPDHPSHRNRVTAQIRRLLERPFDLAVGGGDAARDLVHVDDVVAAILAAATAARPQEILAAGEPVTQRGLGRLVARAAGKRSPLVVSLPVPIARLAASTFDLVTVRDRSAGAWRATWTLTRSWSFRAEGFREALGREPLALADGVKRTVEWIRSGAR